MIELLGAVLLLGLVVALGIAYLRQRAVTRDGPPEPDPDELRCTLDRMENAIRRDPYRDDMKDLYVEYLHGAKGILDLEEIERRRAFLREIGYATPY